MPDNTALPPPSILNAPAGCHDGQADQTWHQVAYRSIAHQLTDVFTTCAQAAELLTTATLTPPPSAAGTGFLLDLISHAEQALDAAHDLAYQASNTSQPYCALCGEPIAILASTGTNWQHCSQERDPATGWTRITVRPMGHLPVPAWRPRPRPAIVAGHIAPQEP